MAAVYVNVDAGKYFVKPFDDIEGMQSFAAYCDIVDRLYYVDRLLKSEICALADEISSNLYLMTTPPDQWLHADADESLWILDNTHWLVAGLYCLAEDDMGAALSIDKRPKRSCAGIGTI